MIVIWVIIFILSLRFVFELAEYFFDFLANINLKVKKKRTAILCLGLSIITWIFFLKLLGLCIVFDAKIYRLLYIYIIYVIAFIFSKMFFLKFYYCYFSFVNSIFYIFNLKVIYKLLNIKKKLMLINLIFTFIVFISVVLNLNFYLTYLFFFKILFNFLIFIININMNKDFNLCVYENYYDENYVYNATGLYKLMIFKKFLITNYSNYNFLSRHEFYLYEIWINNEQDNNYIIIEYKDFFIKKCLIYS